VHTEVGRETWRLTLKVWDDLISSSEMCLIVWVVRFVNGSSKCDLCQQGADLAVEIKEQGAIRYRFVPVRERWLIEGKKRNRMSPTHHAQRVRHLIRSDQVHL